MVLSRPEICGIEADAEAVAAAWAAGTEPTLLAAGIGFEAAPFFLTGRVCIP